MELSSGGEGPALLQLHNWTPSQLQLKLSDFREAFISPTRELLLLLSYHCEASLLPLFSGQSINCDEPESCFCGGAPSSSDRLDSTDSAQPASDPESLFAYSEFSCQTKIEKFHNYPFICDVNSLAWGACHDTYNQHEGLPFKEFLFVSGNNGVTVHAFCQPDSTAGTMQIPTFKGENEVSGQGMWVEWGPFAALAHNKGVGEAVNRTAGNSKFRHDNNSGDTGNDESSRSKRWLRTFLTEVQTVESKGYLWTKLPKKPSFPSCTRVVSFSIFDNISPNLDFFSAMTSSTLKKERQEENFAGSLKDIPVKDAYKCFTVFASNSHNLIGFVLKMVDERSWSRHLLVVARLLSLEIQWVFSVNLEETLNFSEGVEWTDFRFADDYLLVCLTATGLVSFYSAETGDYLAHQDILHFCGHTPRMNLQTIRDDISEDRTTHQTDTSLCKRTFRRLIIASQTLHIAAIDEYGIIYVISACNYVSEKYYPFRKLLPHIHYRDLGGYDIGHQRVFPNQHSNSYPIRNGSNIRNEFRKKPHHYMREIILPTDKYSEDDIMCFSLFGITRLTKQQLDGDKKFKIVHSYMHTDSSYHDDGCLISNRETYNNLQIWEKTALGEVLGCTFQGCFYLLTQSGLSVFLPSVSVSSNLLPIEWIAYQPLNISAGNELWKENVGLEEQKQRLAPWKVEILDRVLLYEGPEEADHLCLENGWDPRIARVRRLQLALNYVKFAEIEQALEMLEDVNLAEEGVLTLVFAAVYLLLCKAGNESEVSTAFRLLAMATCFATKMIHKYGMALNNKSDNYIESTKRLREMAHFLESTRTLQCRFGSKLKRPGHRLGDDEELSLMKSQEDSQLSILSRDVVSMRDAPSFPQLETGLNNTEKLALMPMGSIDSKPHLDSENLSELSVLSSLGAKNPPFENTKDMIARWEIDNLDLKNVVKDALLSGRLPLAVLQLHLHHLKDLIGDREPHDTFTEVRDVGTAIAYDLFLKGETDLAIATLQRLGEDMEASLKQLVFGTVRRYLRMQVAEELSKFGYLGPHELKILERLALIERLYPSSSFWRIFLSRQKESMIPASGSSSERRYSLRLLQRSHFVNNPLINCGEIDGVVLGSWKNIDEHPADSSQEEDSNNAGYWVAAAIWSDSWDQRTIDRIVLDQPSLMGVHVLWESQLEYHICHNDWEEVCKLLDVIPKSLLVDGSLQISLDGSSSASDGGCLGEYPGCDNYICSLEELDVVSMDISDIKIFRFSANKMCSTWLRIAMEEALAKKFIFLKEYWDGTAELVSLLARSDFVTGRYSKYLRSSSELDLPDPDEESNSETVKALHKTFVHHCVQYNLPNLLDLYLDHHKLVLDNDSLCLLQEAAGDCHWAKWLLLSRIKGHEYESSLCNARSIMARNLVHDTKISRLEIDQIVQTVDDIAEGGWEMAALATLMYAPVPIQHCLSSGSVSKNCNTSAQCTLENLKPTFQRFPTLWRTLVGSCLGQDTTSNFRSPKAKNVYGSAFPEYLTWREKIFSSAGDNTSLLQMLPRWFSRAVRRLIQLYVQGPLEWQTLAGVPTGESYLHFIDANEHTEITPMSWEETIQDYVEEELYASSLKEIGWGLEPHLHRGRALAAFNHILDVRVQKLKSEHMSKEKGGQTIVQSDVQMLLAPLTQSEESLLSSVMPLAIMHFEDPVLVASCAFLLELCGLSGSMLRVDIAALKRISSFYKLAESNQQHRQLSPKGSAFYLGDLTDSLARALADEYSSNMISRQKGISSSKLQEQPSQALMLVLQHLEKVSLPLLSDGTTYGSWLSSGNGDGTEFRNKQKEASQHWNLVTVFCQIHQIPLSTKYLALLARDNDWVGFLSEAQVGGYPFDATIQVASKEFSDPRLKAHILTVLKNMQSRRTVSSSTNSSTMVKMNENPFPNDKIYTPLELFGILAECEKQNNPGETLLLKAKEMGWSILALVASCFSDVSPLSCLTVWLEITAARETSSIKVNDIASQIANNVGAAVEANNSLPVTSRALTLHYNRRNLKRRRLMKDSNTSDFSSTNLSVVQGVIPEDIAIPKEESGKEDLKVSINSSSEVPDSLSKMVAVLCEQHLFLPLLRAFEMFLPSCSLLPFIRALQAFSQMRLSEASAHIGSFSSRIKEETPHIETNNGNFGSSWISFTATKAANALLSTCPSPYEKRCLLRLLASTDFGDGGSASTYYQRLYWKINLAEPSLRKDDSLHLGNETLDDASLLEALEKNGHWEQARNWARQLEVSGGPWRSAFHHVTEKQAESMVAEWKEFLWDVPEERVALWGHCQMLFLRYSFPALQAGLFFLKHAEAADKDLPARELHELLLLSLQWLSGMITFSNPVYPLHLLREIETRVWLLAVESEAQVKSEGDFNSTSSHHENGNTANIVDRTAIIITKMDNHMNTIRNKNDTREYHNNQTRNPQFLDSLPTSTKAKRRAKSHMPSSRRPVIDIADNKSTDSEDGCSPPFNYRNDEEPSKIELTFSRWEERVGPAELERAVLSLLEFGQLTAAKQLQHKLSPTHIPPEFVLVNASLKLASISTPTREVSITLLDEEVRSVIQSYNILPANHFIDPLQVLETLATVFTDGGGRGLCKRIVAVVKAANVLGITFSEAFDKQPIELLQLLSLKAQESFDEANLLVQTHFMPASSIAQILAESFLKGLLAAHRGGYMDSQKEEGPAPLLWRFSDFFKWAELCPSEPEMGHALMRLVITGHEIPHACEVELLILSHHFYKSSACLDGVDVLVALAATRVESYVTEGDFPCLARLITGVGNFYALDFILGILIENSQLNLLLHKYSAAADANKSTAEAVRGFRMAVLTSLRHFNPNDLDAFAMVYNHFDMKHEAASLLEFRAKQSVQQYFLRYDKDQNEDLLESMRYFIEAAEVHSSIDAGSKTHSACAQASLISLQIRMPDFHWLNLSETNARRALVEQSRFQEALIVAEAYNLNQPSEWALVLWNQMLKPELTEQFVAEFVAVLPLHPSMLVDLARFYRAEVAARGDQSQFSVWLTGGGLPAEWAKYLGRSFRCLLRRTRDLRLRVQLATLATGFSDVINGCMKALDKVPDNAGPLVLRKGHGGGYLPLM